MKEQVSLELMEPGSPWGDGPEKSEPGAPNAGAAAPSPMATPTASAPWWHHLVFAISVLVAAAVIVPSDEIRNIATSPDALYTMVSEAVDRANSRLSQLERVRRFIIADEPFGTENGQMTATLKVRRHVVREIYGDRIEALYPQK